MQISMFDGAKPFKITKPIRLITLFSGYDSQALSLKYLGIPFEHYKTSEWAIKSIQALKDLHFSNDNTDYSGNMTIAEVKAWLSGRISSDYSTPLNDKQIERLSEKEARKIYNNMRATHNLGSIMAINGKDLEITDTDKYCYIMTYSFPCQDLSSAGKGKGMGRDSGTRSGLLWEVERMLKELSGYIPHRVKPNGKIFSATEWVDTYEPADTTKLPQVLLMENVPEVIGAKNIKHFAEWQAFLEKLGYKNKWECLNAKDFGIAQNRNRCFMVSILGDYYYDFTQNKSLQVKLKDMLEKEVDEKYYLSDKQLIYAFDCNRVCDNTKRGDLGDRVVNPQIAKTISCRGAESQRADITNFVVGDNSIEYTLGEIRDIINLKRELESKDELCSDLRIRKFTPKECWRLMGVKDEDYEKVAKNQSNASLYHLAGDSIVVNVLMAIFGEMCGVDYKNKIDKLVEELTNEW